MAKLLRKRIVNLENENKELLSKLKEWEDIGCAMFNLYREKKVYTALKNTKYFLLMITLTQERAISYIKKKMDEELFGDLN